MSIDVNFMIGGEAGQGVQSAGFLLAKSLNRCSSFLLTRTMSPG
jgi:Pyruvate/2-oxoacid:ferredoxin oxidoreductase gamma subunit